MRRSAVLLIAVTLLMSVALRVRAAQDSTGSPAAAPAAPSQEVLVDTPQTFDAWLGKLIDEARSRGFSDEIIKQTLLGLQPLPQVIRSDRNQAELNPGFNRYLSAHLPASLVQQGRSLMQQHAELLGQLESRFGVPGSLVVAIWGMETRYGRVMGRTPIFRALATLAWEPRRADFFRGELFQALMMVDHGYIDAASMTGSWAGAMGQTQFMPSSYMAYAVDYDGDGHRDIWRSTPDALASIANYLKGYGWTGGRSWGREVKVPADAQAYAAEFVPKRTDGCYAQRNMTERVPMSVWREVGVTNVDGTPVPASDVVAGLVDVGERTFLVYPNYDAILGYNCAHYYALTAAILSEQFGGTTDEPSPRVGAVPASTTKATSTSKSRPKSSRPKSRSKARRASR